MKSILARIAAVLRSLPKFVYERICIAGEWVSRLVAVPAEPSAGELPAAEIAKAEVDEHTAAVRAVAGHLLARTIPAPELSGRLSEADFDWLLACTPSMLKSIVAAKDRELRDHIRGKQSIRGVLVNDEATVALFIADAAEHDGRDLAWATPAMVR